MAEFEPAQELAGANEAAGEVAAARRGVGRGCGLFLFSGLMLVGSMVTMLWIGWKQQQEIRAFSATEPIWAEVAPVDEAATADLRQRLKAFADEVRAGRPTAIELSVADLNRAIADYRPLEPLRGLVHLRRVGSGSDQQPVLIADICFPSRSLLPWQATPYLNGSMELRPRLEGGSLALDVLQVTSFNGSVPEPVRNHYQQQDLFLSALRQPSLTRVQEVFSRLKVAELTGRGVLLANDEAVAAAWRAEAEREAEAAPQAALAEGERTSSSGAEN